MALPNGPCPRATPATHPTTRYTRVSHYVSMDGRRGQAFQSSWDRSVSTSNPILSIQSGQISPSSPSCFAPRTSTFLAVLVASSPTLSKVSPYSSHALPVHDGDPTSDNQYINEVNDCRLSSASLWHILLPGFKIVQDSYVGLVPANGILQCQLFVVTLDQCSRVGCCQLRLQLPNITQLGPGEKKHACAALDIQA